MPFTPYHFGPSGFVALILRKYIDIPVFLLANVIVDIEVLFYPHWPVHRYAHTLLIGSVLGAAWAVAAYPLRNFFKKIMQIIRIPYQTGFWKMVVSGVLGVWVHIIIDAVYHWDVRVFWPSRWKSLYALLSRGQIKFVCIAFFFAAAVAYLVTVVPYIKQNKAKKTAGREL